MSLANAGLPSRSVTNHLCHSKWSKFAASSHRCQPLGRQCCIPLDPVFAVVGRLEAEGLGLPYRFPSICANFVLSPFLKIEWKSCLQWWGKKKRLLVTFMFFYYYFLCDQGLCEWRCVCTWSCIKPAEYQESELPEMLCKDPYPLCCNLWYCLSILRAHVDLPLFALPHLLGKLVNSSRHLEFDPGQAWTSV